MPAGSEPFAAGPSPPAPLQLGPSPIAVACKLLASRAASGAVVMSPTPRPSLAPDGLHGGSLQAPPTHLQNGLQQRGRMGAHAKPRQPTANLWQQSGECRQLQRSSSGEAASCLGSFELIELQGKGLDAAHAGSPVLRTRPPPLSREEWATFFSPSDGEPNLSVAPWPPSVLWESQKHLQAVAWTLHGFHKGSIAFHCTWPCLDFLVYFGSRRAL